MNTKLKYFSFAAMMTFASCSEPLNDVLDETSFNTVEILEPNSFAYKDFKMQRFAVILSKAVANNREVRAFLKDEAIKKIDNDYNVFYPISKRRIVGEIPLNQVLAKYANEAELEDILSAIPLLNIHLPELAGSTVADLDPDDEELPVLYNNVMYFDGQAVDTLHIDEIPGFNILVLTESTSIRKKGGLTKSCSNLSLDSEYEYVDASFKPREKGNSLTKVAEYENKGAKYYDEGPISSSELDNKLITAYEISKSNKFAQRTVMYYNWTSLNDSKTIINKSVAERIFRFKLNDSIVSDYDELTRKTGEGLMFDNSTSQKKSEMTRTQVIKNLVNGRRFEFRFIISTPNGSDGYIYNKKEFSIYASASDLFDFRINTDRRHKTSFRHTKYTYTFNAEGTRAKWYYPEKYSGNIDFWYTDNGVYQKFITVYLVNPKTGSSKTITETISTSKSKKWDLGISLTSKIGQFLSLGITGSIGGSNTKTVTNTVSYTINYSDKLLGTFTVDFFNSSVIDSMNGNIVNLTPCHIGNGFYINIIPSCY